MFSLGLLGKMMTIDTEIHMDLTYLIGETRFPEC